jgi:hypothetical protein
MTKADLMTIIADKLKFPWARAELLVDTIFACMEQSISRGEKIEIRATRPNYPYTQSTPMPLHLAHGPSRRRQTVWHRLISSLSFPLELRPCSPWHQANPHFLG